MRFSNSKFDRVVLEDGSAVVMNDSSTIEYQQGRSERMAMLSGEAMFEVRREQRPFKIKTADAQVEVLGTSFVVKAYPGKPTQVIVISGKVKIRTAEKELLLTAGEMTTIHGNLTRKLPNENPNFNSWYTGVLEFRNEPLGQVLKELEDQFDVRFIVDQPQILTCGFTGKFENAKLEEVLRALSYSLNLEFDRKDQTTLVARGEGCIR
jgi:ferric-dicitrate binding protein FerR (iron transport regulator)